MTDEIRLQQASYEHMTKQPTGLRYALFCDPVLKGILEGRCDSQRKMGHLGDFVDYPSAKTKALDHPHATVLRFYPDLDTLQPSNEFLADFRKRIR